MLPVASSLISLSITVTVHSVVLQCHSVWSYKRLCLQPGQVLVPASASRRRRQRQKKAKASAGLCGANSWRLQLALAGARRGSGACPAPAHNAPHPSPACTLIHATSWPGASSQKFFIWGASSTRIQLY